MPQEETPQQPRRRRRKSKPSPGVWIGRFVFLVVGILGTLFYLEVREVGFEAAVQNLQTKFAGKRENVVVHKPLTGGRVVDAVDADTRPLHEQDPRWEASIALAEEGVKQREDALHQHYEVEGDPFRLREQMIQAFDKLTAALVDLHAMREEYSRSKESRMQLDFQIERFEKIANTMTEKNNRR